MYMRNYVLIAVVTLMFIVGIWLTNDDVPVISGRMPVTIINPSGTTYS